MGMFFLCTQITWSHSKVDWLSDCCCIPCMLACTSVLACKNLLACTNSFVCTSSLACMLFVRKKTLDNIIFSSATWSHWHYVIFDSHVVWAFEQMLRIERNLRLVKEIKVGHAKQLENFCTYEILNQSFLNKILDQCFEYFTLAISLLAV